MESDYQDYMGLFLMHRSHYSPIFTQVLTIFILFHFCISNVSFVSIINIGRIYILGFRHVTMNTRHPFMSFAHIAHHLFANLSGPDSG